MKKLLTLFSLVLTSLAYAQSTVINGPIVDQFSNTWSFGTVTAVFQRAPNSSTRPVWSGGTLITNPPTVSMDSGGNFTMSLPSNTAITPSGSSWVLSVCPNATLQCAVLPVALAGGTVNINPILLGAGVFPTATVPPTQISKVYNINETFPPPLNQGGMLYDTTTQQLLLFTSTGWQPFASVGGIPILTNPLGNQTVTQPLNTVFNFITSGIGAVEINGSPIVSTASNFSVLNTIAGNGVGTIKFPNPFVDQKINNVGYTDPTSGVDLGVQVAALVNALPIISSGTYHFGTIHISQSSSNNGIQTFSTPIGGPSSLLAYVDIECDPGVVLQYTGVGNWISALDPNGVDSSAYPVFTVNGCTLLATAPAAGVVGILFGNIVGARITNDTFFGFSATNDSAVQAENTVFFTEHFDTSGSIFVNNTNAITLFDNCGVTVGCTGSFEHSKLDFYCASSSSILSNCLRLVGGAQVQFDVVALRFNLNGPSGAAAINIDTTSIFQQNLGTITGENDTAGNGAVVISAGGVASLTAMSVMCGGCTTSSNNQNFNTYGGTATATSISINSPLTDSAVFVNGNIEVMNNDLVSSNIFFNGGFKYSTNGPGWFMLSSGTTLTQFFVCPNNTLGPGAAATCVMAWQYDMAGNLTSTGSVKWGGSAVTIASSTLVPQVGTPTAGQVACIKSSGPPVIIGFCTGTVSGTSSCTCN